MFWRQQHSLYWNSLIDGESFELKGMNVQIVGGINQCKNIFLPAAGGAVWLSVYFVEVIIINSWPSIVDFVSWRVYFTNDKVIDTLLLI